MSTALDLITEALLDLGVIADEEAPTASQAKSALNKLNNMIDSWNIQQLAIYGVKEYVFPFVNGQATYTLGPTGNFVMPRPTFIDSAFIRDISQPAMYRQDIPIWIYSDDEYQDYGYKSMTLDRPFGIWFNYATPLVQATLVPIPVNPSYSLVLWANTQIGNLALNDTVTLAPGYKRALSTNLQIELAASYGPETQPTATTLSIARNSLADLKAYNFKPEELGNGYGWFSYRTGMWQY